MTSDKLSVPVNHEYLILLRSETLKIHLVPNYFIHLVNKLFRQNSRKRSLFYLLYYKQIYNYHECSQLNPIYKKNINASIKIINVLKTYKKISYVYVCSTRLNTSHMPYQAWYTKLPRPLFTLGKYDNAWYKMLDAWW